MKKILPLFIAFLTLISCSKDDGYHEFVFNTYCYATRNNKSISCYFYFFEKGDYISVVRNDFDSKNLGLATATTKDGKEVQSVGYCLSLSNESSPIAKYRYGIPDLGGKEIVEGEYYIACFPSIGTGGQHPYKAKSFTKAKDKALMIKVDFNYYTSYEPGYKYLEWDE